MIFLCEGLMCMTVIQEIEKYQVVDISEEEDGGGWMYLVEGVCVLMY